MSRAKKCGPAPEPAPVHNGTGPWASFWKLVAVAACTAILTLGASLYNDVRTALADHDARVRSVETRQAVQDATRVDIERRLQEISAKLDELLRAQRPTTSGPTGK